MEGSSEEVTRTDGEQAVLLNTQFLFQNKSTGQASHNHLSTRQLCRMLCPTTAAATTTPLRQQFVTPETYLLQQNPDGSYVAEWKQASTIPVLREVSTLWYTSTATTNGENGPSTVVSPPQTCQQLLQQQSNSSARHGVVVIQYASALTESKWKPLEELPSLQLAMEALDSNMSTATNVHNNVAADSSQQVAAESQQVQEELRAFLSASVMGGKSTDADDDEEEKPRDYQLGDAADSSQQQHIHIGDDGTKYVRDPLTNRWIHEGYNNNTTTKQDPTSNNNNDKGTSTGGTTDSNNNNNKRKRKKPKFSAKKGRCWVYVTGIPPDATPAEVSARFSKAGLLDLNPETQQPKVKLYRSNNSNNNGELKGDASICYARPESVPLAMTLLDGAPFRLDSGVVVGTGTSTRSTTLMTVEPAKFEQHGEVFDDSKSSKISTAKRKVAKLATRQAMDWDEGVINGRLTGGRKGLRIIVLKHMFDPPVTDDDASKVDATLAVLEPKLRSKCEEWGPVEKITVFSRHPEGVVIVKFTQPGSASDAVKYFDGNAKWNGRTTKASFWDGVTDFTVRNEEQERKEEDERHEAFGEWLDNQDLPEELRLKSE